MRRRAFLASTSALLGTGLAGCSALGSEADPDRTTRGTTTRQATTSEQVALDATVLRLQPALVSRSDSGPTIVGDSQQYLFYRVDVTDGESPARLDLAFRLGGRTYSPGVSAAEPIWVGLDEADRYSANTGEGWLVFELPDDWSAKHAAFGLGSREWPVGDGIRERMAAAPPDLEIAWDPLETARPGDVVHEFDVSNESDRATRFVGVLTASGLDAEEPLAVFNRRVPANSGHSFDVSVPGLPADSSAVGDGDSDVTYELQWAGGVLEQDVRFVQDSESF
jgi:hypothetical protein